MTSRELVLSTLEGRNTTGRVPRQMWWLPWAMDHHAETLEAIWRDFPDDIGGARTVYATPPRTQGDATAVGEYVDEWGCRFINIHKGIIGEVKRPLMPEEDDAWSSAEDIRLPEELLSFDADAVNRDCAETDRFVMGGFCPRPFERLQFLRGTENLYMDLMDPPEKMTAFIRRMHDFYCRLLEKWAKTDVDALQFMDDWGAQNSLLIHPQIWCDIFKPLYRDYIDIAHSHGKKAFMHSDGYILAILPHLIELGLDAVNCQVFCMGLDKLAPFKGQITFWGEMDRQHLLCEGTTEEVRAAARCMKETLWQDGGLIAQFEFGPGARPENAYAVFEAFAE